MIKGESKLCDPPMLHIQKKKKSIKRILTKKSMIAEIELLLKVEFIIFQEDVSKPRGFWVFDILSGFANSSDSGKTKYRFLINFVYIIFLNYLVFIFFNRLIIFVFLSLDTAQ